MSELIRLSPHRGALPAPILGESASLRRAVGLAERYAAASVPILLIGATGTGKELFARHIHWLSGRRGEFVDIDCGAIPTAMAESLLFGHQRGSFTGAASDAEGLLAHADQGTLFLDELPSLPLESQTKLLRVLDTAEYRRLGETRKRRVACGVVAAAQDDLRDRLHDGRLRLDLYQRLAVGIVHLPMLVERLDDIWLLAGRFATEAGVTLQPECRPVLEGHPWPGNIRELRACVKRASLLAAQPWVTPGDVAAAIDLLGDVGDAPLLMGQVELLRVGAIHHWHPATMARALGISRATLYRRLRTAGIDPARRRKASHGVSLVSGLS